MNIIFDLIPFVGFLIVLLYDNNIYTATTVLMILMPLTIGFYWLLYRRFDKMQLITLSLVLIFGTATLVFKNPLFIKWKPTIVEWLFAGVFLFTQFVSKKPLTQRLMGNQVELPQKTWDILNFSWALFFVLMGCLNLYFAYSFSTIVWAKFKVFGGLGLTFLFVIIQGVFISKHLKNGEP